MMRITFLVIILLSGMTGCTSTVSSTPPQWSTAVPQGYPVDRYLTAIGEASSRDLAEQRALSALARVFEVNIKEDNADFSLFRQATGQRSETINRQISSRQLQTDTEQVIEGAVPVEYWSQNQRHLVLVALERRGAEQRLSLKIAQLDQQTSALSRYADNKQLNSVVQISALAQALQLQLQRAPLNRNLSVISGKQIMPFVTVANLEQRIRNQLAGLHFSLSAESDLLPWLEHAVGQIGAKVSAEGELQLSGIMDREPVTRQQGWYWLRGSMQLTLGNSSGTIIAQQRWPVKVSAQEAGMIEQRLRDQTNAQIADRLFQMLTATQISM